MDPKNFFFEWDLEAIFFGICFLKKYLIQKIIEGKKCSKLPKNSFKDVLKNSQPFFAHPSLT